MPLLLFMQRIYLFPLNSLQCAYFVFIAKMKLTEDDEDEVATDMEGLITFYCKSRAEKYRSTSGLVELLSPFITLNLPLSEVYNCFYAMQSKFIPRYVCLNILLCKSHMFYNLKYYV